MTGLYWLALGFPVQVVVGWRFPWLVGTGRILSRPLWRFRPFRPFVVQIGEDFYVSATFTRLAQLLVLIVLYLPAMLLLGGIWITPLFWTIIIALYGDDYLTGDNGRWQRFKGRLRKLVPARQRKLVTE